MAVDAAAERQALALSAGAALALGGAALAVAWRTGSGAVMLDAAFNLCFFAAALATLKVARLAQRPDDARYPFGYLQFEPLINLAKGLLILGVGMLALLDSSLALLRGGTAVEAGLALAYAGAATLGCGGTLLILRRLQRRAASPLVQGDIENWTVNTAISAGMVLAFALALGLGAAGQAAAARLVDPALVALVVLLTIALPVRLSLASLGGLLMRAPDAAVTASVEAALGKALAGLALERLYVRVQRPGRMTYVLAHALVARGERVDLARADALRQAAILAVAARHAPLTLDLIFTGVRDYAAPTAGFAAGSVAGAAIADE